MQFVPGVVLIALLVTATPPPALAYQCALSPAGDAVIIKTDNAGAQPVTCKVDCTFMTPDGPATVSCSQQIPAGAKGWYVCLRPTGGKTMTLSSGSESCK